MQTNRKLVELQMARIERRQSNIRRIQERVYGMPKEPNDVAMNPGADYDIGKSENNFERIIPFLKTYEDDPAVKVSSQLIPFVSH